MSAGEAIGVGLAIGVVGIVVIAIRGLPALAWFQNLFDKRVKVFEGPPSEAHTFEEALEQARISCDVHIGIQDLTMEVWVREKQASDARALIPYPRSDT